MPLTEKQKHEVCSCFLFQGMNAGQMEKISLIDSLTAVKFAAGQEIYSARNFRRAIGILTSGRVVVHKGHEVELNALHAGDCFGVAAMFHPVKEYVATVQAKTAAEVVFISDGQLKELFSQYPQTAINYIAFLSQRIHFLNRKIDSFTAPNAQAGLCLYLLENQRDGIATISGGYSRLARQLNIGRASLYRILDQLEKREIIRREEKTVFLLDVESLRSLK